MKADSCGAESLAGNGLWRQLDAVPAQREMAAGPSLMSHSSGTGGEERAGSMCVTAASQQQTFLNVSSHGEHSPAWSGGCAPRTRPVRSGRDFTGNWSYVRTNGVLFSTPSANRPLADASSGVGELYPLLGSRQSARQTGIMVCFSEFPTHPIHTESCSNTHLGLTHSLHISPWFPGLSGVPCIHAFRSSGAHWGGICDST